MQFTNVGDARVVGIAHVRRVIIGWGGGMRFARHMSIRRKYLIFFLFACLLPVVVMGGYSYMQSLNALKKQAEISTVYAVDRVGANIDQFILSLNHYSTIVVNDKVIMGAADNPDASERNVNLSLVSLRDSLTIPVTTTVVFFDGRVYGDRSLTESERDNLKGLLNQKDINADSGIRGDMRFAGRFPSLFSGQSQYSYYFYRSIISRNRGNAGIVLIGVGDYLINRIMFALVENGGSSALLFDAGGDVLASDNAPDAPDIRYLSEADGNGVILSGKAVYMYKLNQVDWKVAFLSGQVPESGEINHILGLLLIIIVALLAVSTLFYYTVSRDVTGPIVNLSVAMAEKVKVHGAPPANTDEVSVLINGYNDMLDSLERYVSRVKSDERQLNEFEYRMLQAQINPHFLYNTLNTLRWMADIMGCENISRAVCSLTNLLRYSIDNPGASVTLKDETAYLESYMHLNNLRYNNKFLLENKIASKYEHMGIMKFVLQPIVENSVIHGFRTKYTLCKIVLSLERREQGAAVIIEDNGAGIGSLRVDDILGPGAREHGADSIGLGLNNVDKRIKLKYGEQYGLKLIPLDAGLRVEILLPFEEAGQ